MDRNHGDPGRYRHIMASPVTYWIDRLSNIDPSKVRIEIPQINCRH